jgi:hypothetical protein
VLSTADRGARVCRSANVPPTSKSELLLPRPKPPPLRSSPLFIAPFPSTADSKMPPNPTSESSTGYLVAFESTPLQQSSAPPWRPVKTLFYQRPIHNATTHKGRTRRKTYQGRSGEQNWTGRAPRGWDAYKTPGRCGHGVYLAGCVIDNGSERRRPGLCYPQSEQRRTK